MPTGGEQVLLAILGCCILPPLFMPNWRALGLCLLVGLGLCAALFAVLWVTADPGVLLARANAIFAIFAAIALLAGTGVKALLFLIWPPRPVRE